MYTPVVGMKPLGQFHTLKEAAKSLFAEVKETKIMIDGFLDTVWMEGGGGYLYDFYVLRDLAIDNGWLETGTGNWIG
jgi:hypothetical protein